MCPRVSTPSRSFDEAMVLRQTPFGESDAVVTLFTRAHGRISALARGARASKRRFAGALGLLVLARVDVKRRPRGDRGGVLCASCGGASRGAGVRPLPDGARAYLPAARAAPRLADAAAQGATADDHDRSAARDAVVGMITGLVGHPLRSIEFIA